ncbi:hypothetical protein L8R80_17610 [Vibrio splendidus]|uniref:hypothetical protein n=1 Tax=Vibrio splendidus TaxID=29497 RepID=UPI002469A3B2|nr:hypothetical protein [Vibrio splendidus]MDH5914606.1 hypothetical protein [Vibrio splendidus]MDH5943303.1 hypothetical protein [Vibrio splendidus]MDH5995052.1 hypothetical protein [Vibrio splendidus]
MNKYCRDVIKESKKNPQLKVKLLLILFRWSQLRKKNKLLSVIFVPIHLIYYIYSNFFLGIELPVGVKVDMPLTIWHGTGIVVNPRARIKANVTLRNGVVIGNDGLSDECPVIDSECSIGANAVIVGGVSIGKYTKIGPCSFVNFDVDSYKKVINCTITK